MTREERIARSELVALASHERGRRLLQLSLRGIQESERGLTIGCWVKPNGGVSGCVFQHAYWQGAAEGAFAPASAAKPEIKGFVPAEDFHLVMDAIRALDVLGKRRFLHRRGLRRVLDETTWRDTVERLLVDALADSAPLAERPTALAAK
ncbi:MAG: hypothetical protein E6G67_05405 [Actinobacteria bacterium]|nr:MAG: hypothetical protein E6G67_05405 [Actinomycetota bacterium]